MATSRIHSGEQMAAKRICDEAHLLCQVLETIQIFKKQKFTPTGLRLSTLGTYSTYSEPILPIYSEPRHLEPRPQRMLTRISHTDCLLRSRPLRACIFVFRSLLSGIPGGGGPTELRVFNSVGRRSFFGAARIPSTLCNKRRAAVAPSWYPGW